MGLGILWLKCCRSGLCFGIVSDRGFFDTNERRSMFKTLKKNHEAMVVRSVLGKLGRSRFIHNNERLTMAGSSPTVCSSPHHPFDYYGVVHDQNKADQKRNPFLHGSLMKKPVYSHLDFGGLGPARFATEELRKKMVYFFLFS
ncbi:hypothetical protein PRUPE_6G034600 [Prunus persica]|uniref:Uncharacterized protein n=1 Tax=Prunus persica TaxID=3760 RepID=A0A251NJL6_PRUPE|nr:hypothetical protein PRUPE_6G034600 [Prunus persica]